MSTSARNRLNRIVRTTLPGGAGVLDLLELAHQISTRQPPESAEGKLALLFEDRLNAIANEMRDRAVEIKREARE